MKQFLHSLAITLCIALMATGAQAQTITAEQAKEIANSFFSNGKQKSAAARSTVSLAKSADSRILSNGSSNEAPTFHILTPASGEGFVIVSGEEIENPIIGYSFEGTIDTSNLPDGFVDYITDIDVQVKALRKYNAENPQKAAAARSAMQKTNYNATTMGNKVYLETASWGQDYPFNTQCFTSYNGSTNALTGCVPTAYAIIMRYHEWPQVGTGTLYNCQAPTYVEITDRTYDYSKMPLVYDGNWSTEQINEVAKLMSHLGHSFMVTYGSSQTSVSDPSNTDKPNKYFNYNLVSASYQANFTMDSWEEKIKESIDNGCPIPYASDNAGTGDTRHMFVLDGYTQNDYFHFNFGWYGNGNGWFKLDAITPSQGDNYSWQDGADHYAIFNFTPNKTKYAVNASVSPENAGTVSVNGSAAASSATGEYLQGATVTLAATANTGYTFSNWTKGGEVVSTNKSCQIKVDSSDNDYVANFLTVGNTTVNVSVTYNGSYGTVTGTSGTVANGTTLTPRLNEEVTLTATPADGYIFTGWTVTKGTEDDTYNTNTLTFVATGEMSVTANFALAVQDYVVNPQTGTLNNGTNRSSVWTFTTVGDFTAALSISATDSNGNVVNSITNKTSGTAGHYFAPSGIIANTETPSSSPTIYTISVPNGYKITGYAITYYPENGSITLTNELGHNETATSSSSDYYLNASGLNVQSTTYTVAGTGRMTTLSFSVTVMKDDGTGGGSTPTPTQYTITATANPGTAGSVTGGGTYNEGATVTLTATPNSGYEFVNWTSGTTTVSTSATYSFTANASASYVANFQAAAPTTFAVTTTANPAAGGTATFAVGTGQATTSATVASGTGVTLYAVANDGYRFVNWTKGGMEVSTNATHNVTITEASDYVANFEEEATATEYPTPTGDTYTDNYLTSITTTGGDTNIGYSANAHPGQSLVVVPGKVQLEKGKSFTMNLVAYSLGAGSSSETREDMRYCHASLFTDFDQDFTFGEPEETWGNQPPTHNVYGNYDLVMNITHTITVPDDAPIGESRIRMIYTNAWNNWPANGTAELDKGIVYDIVVEVVEKVDITANAGEGGSVTINGEATGTKRVVKGSEVALAANANDGYNFTGWHDGETLISNENPYTFTATASGSYEARFEVAAPVTYTISVSADPGTAGTASIGTETSTTVTAGEQVTLTAVPNSGYNFAGWYKDETKVSDATSYTFVPTESANYVARFEVAAPVTYTISVSADPGTAGTASIGTETSTTVTAGEQVTLTAVPNSGYNFAGWYKDETKVSDATSYTFVPTESANYVARFEEEAAVGGGNETMHNIVTNNTTGIVSETSGTLSKIWTYSGSPEITITSSDYTISNRDAAINLRAANYTITAPEGFEIVSYTINFQTSYEATITAGTTSESYTTANSLTFNAENINAKSATFSLSMAAGRNIQVTSIDMVLRATGYVISVVAGEGGNAYIGASGTETETAITIGSNVTLRAEVTEGYEFDGWYDSNGKFISDVAICTITPNDNITYTARFYALVEADKYYRLQCQGSNKYYLSSNINSTDNNRLEMNGKNRIFYYGTLIDEFDNIDDDIEANQKKLLAYTEGNFVGIKKRNTGDYYDVTLLDNRNEISHNVKFNAGTNGNVMISVEYVEYVDENEISTYFYLDGNGTSVGCNTNYINDNSHNWMCEEVTSLPVAISSAQHATLYAPVALEIPDGVRAYVLDASKIDGTSKDIVLTRLSSIIPANTGVILKGNEGIYNFNITESTDNAEAEAAGNALAGTVARTRVVGDAYILAVREGKAGLYPLAGNSYINPDVQTASFTNGSHKAYLPVKDDTLGEILKKSTGVRFIYSDEIVTGIQDGILYDGAEGESIYDLQGRKLSEITEPGIYIVNGKKTFIK